ncbi:hypothetical protein [Streptomyces yatensis]|uniref:hypothetical protein n=1 Tax=Streptomyces yatensis TaxID=155177 RepID=UPI001B3C726C|nr:hypothetical protein [Streptomyces yatensis]
MNKIAHALRSSLVYADRASGALSVGQARELANSIRDTGVPINVAVLPADPAYGGERIFDRLRAAVDRPGGYTVALGSSFGAASDAPALPGHVSQALAQQNLHRHHGELRAFLDGFVADVAARTGGGGDHGVEGDRGSSGLSVGGAGGVPGRPGRARRRRPVPDAARPQAPPGAGAGRPRAGTRRGRRGLLRHGPSIRDVEWAPEGGSRRTIPACAADATRIDDGREPDARTVSVGGDAVHYGDGYDDGGDFGGGFGDGGASEAASVTEVRRTLRGRTADDGETGVDRNLSFHT